MFCSMSQPLEMIQVGCLASQRVLLSCLLLYRFHKTIRAAHTLTSLWGELIITKIFLPCFWQAPLPWLPSLTLLLTPTPRLQSLYSSPRRPQLVLGGSPASSESTSSSRALRPGLWH